MIIDGIEDIEALYTNVTSDLRIARMNLKDENLQIARAVGLRVPKQRFTEIELIKRTRRHIQSLQPQRPCAGCALEGSRWVKFHSGEPLLFSLDRDSLRTAFDNAEQAIHDSISLIKQNFPFVLCREARIGEVPDVTIRAQNIDGQGGTLGFAVTFVSDTSDDLDVGGDRWVSAELVCDSSEFWTYNFFFTVFSHEFIHILGLGHAPDFVTDDIMLPFYAGDRRTYGDWTRTELEALYLGRAA